MRCCKIPQRFLVLSFAFAQTVSAFGDDAPVDVRVGIVAYQDSQADVERIQKNLAALAGKSSRLLRIRFALGTYGDVLHWMNRKYIDVAVLSPGVFAEALRMPADSSRWRYIATMGLPPAQSHLANDDRRQPGYHFQYRSVCVVAAASTIRTVADLRRLAQQNRLRFLFVHPLSVSGRIAPEFALRQIGIVPHVDHVEYTYSHSSSLRLVAEPEDGVERVAFVWDDTLLNEPARESPIRKLDLPELDGLLVPQSAVAARADFEHVELIGNILLSNDNGEAGRELIHFEDWAERYGVVRRWSEAIHLPADSQDARTVSLQEVGRILIHGARSQLRSPRIALVLSGGGAKCAYQVGAVAAIEEELERLRQATGESGLDIGLVVGTSGGAINALPIALGISTTSKGRTDLRRVWESLDQQEIVRPSALVRWNIGLWFLAIQATLVLWLVRRFVAVRERRGAVVTATLAVLGFIQVLLTWIHWDPWPMLGSNHWVHHAWLWAMFGLGWSGWCMLTLGLAGFVAGRWLARRGKRLEGPPQLVRWVLILTLVGLPGLQVLILLFYEQTLTDGTGIEHSLATRLPPLVRAHTVSDEWPGGERETADADRLRLLSRRIIENGLLQRDLVLTGSCLFKTAPELPNDLYFYAVARSSAPPNYGSLGIRLADYPDKLIDVVMGSGSIFPAFPARALTDFPRSGERVDLIDGGFAHNSPIEAAVLWGATHILLIEASPGSAARAGRQHFLQNSIDAFNHLYFQAQLADARSKEKVTIFTLRPQPPHICILDFAGNLIARAIDAGYREAGGRVHHGSAPLQDFPSWEKSLGEPVFLEVDMR